MRAGGGPGIDIYTGVVISKDDDGRRVTVRYESWYTTPTGSANGDQMDVESIPYTSPLLSFVERKPALALLAGAKMPNTGLSDNDTLTVQATIIEVKGLKKADRGLFDTRKNNVYVTLTLQKGEGKKTPVRISGGNAASYNFEITDKATAESVKWGNLMTVADVKAATSGLSLRVEVYDEDKQKGDQLLGQGSVFVHLKDIVEGGSILTELISLDNIALGYDPKGKPLGSVAVRLHATRNSNAKAKIPAAFPIFAWPGKLQIDRPAREQALGKYVIMDKEGDVRGLVTRIEGQGKNIQVLLLDESLRLDEGQYEWVSFGGKGADGVEMLWYVDAPKLRKTLAEVAAAPTVAPPAAGGGVHGVIAPWSPLVVTTLSAPVRAGDTRIQVESQVGCAAGMVVQIGGAPSSSSSSSSAAAPSGTTPPSDVRKIVGFGSVLVDAPLVNSYAAGTTVSVYSADKAPPLTLLAQSSGDAMDEMSGPPTGGDESAPPPLAAPKDKKPKPAATATAPTAVAAVTGLKLTGPKWPGKLQIDRPVREQALGKYVIMDKEGDVRGLVTRIEGQGKNIQVQLLDESLRLEDGQYEWVGFGGKGADGVEMLWYADLPIVTPTHALSIQATSIEVKGLKKADRGVFDTRKNNVYVKLTLQKGEGKKTPVRISGGNAASYNFETTDKATAESVKWGNLMTVADVKAATSGLSLRVEVYDEDKQKGDQLLGQGSVFVHLKDIVEGGSILTELISLDNIALGYDPKGKPLGSVAVRLQVVATPGGGGGGGKVAAGTSAPAAAAAAVVNGPSAVVAVAGGGGAAVVQPLSSAMSTTPSKDKGSDQDQVKDKGSDKVNENGSDQVKDKVQGSDQDKKAVPAAVTKTVVAAEAPSVTVASSTAGPPIGGPPKRPPPKVPSKAAAGGGNVSTTVAAPVGDATGAGAGTGTEIGADTGTGTGTGKTQASNASTDNAPTSTATTPISSPTPATATASVVDKQPPAVATTAATATGAANKTTTPSPSTENKSKTASDPSPSPSPGPVVASANVGTPVAAATNAATAATTAATVTATTPSNTTPGDKGKDKDKVVPSPAASTSTTTPVKATNPSTAPVPVSVSSAVPVPVATSSSALSPVKSSTANPVVPVAAAGNTGTATITGTAGGNSSSAASKGTGTGTSPATPGAAANTNTAANTPNASSIATPDVVSTNASTAISENKPKTPLPAVGASFESGKKLAPLGSTGTGTGASTTTETPISGQGSASKPVLAPIGGGSISKPALAPITTPANK